MHPADFSSESIRPSERFRVLIIDDDESLCEMTAEYLAPLGFEVRCVHKGLEGLQLALDEFWHAVLLDLLLPDIHGFEVLRQIREKSNVPVLMLTALGDSQNQVAGLELGADDYVPKSSPSRELLARLRSVMRRAGWTAQEVPSSVQQEVVFGRLRMNVSRNEASIGDKPLSLTHSEFTILVALVKAGGNTCTREELSLLTTGSSWQSFERGVDMHISSLRKALRDCDPSHTYIETVRSVGYRICRPATDVA